MRKHSLIISLIVAMAVAFTFSVGFAGDPADVMTLKSAVYKKHTKSLVTFSHKAHATDAKYGPVACNDCHHVIKDGKNVWTEKDPVQKCEECHADTGKPPKEMSKKDKIAKFHKEALHANCAGCHKKVAKETGNKEISKCTACHPKKKK